MLRTTMPHNLFNSLQTFAPSQGKTAQFYSLPQLEKEDIAQTSKLPISIRIVLESVLRNFDGQKITEEDVRAIASWQAKGERREEVPFVVARVLLHDFTGVPLVVDLAAMRSAVVRLNKNPGVIEPLVPVDLVIDHSVQVDFSSSDDAFRKNMEMEFRRNNSRYQFLKWGMQAFDGFRVIPPGIGICHQVNLEYLAKCVWGKHGMYYPDSLVGTDSHTTMVNGLSVVGWGVGGIEAEAAMLGQPVYFLTPDVVGVHLTGRLREGVTATDLVLAVTEMLRKTKVVGKFVEYHGEGAASLSVTDPATIANMSPEYGATMGYFPPDEETCVYLKATGRSDEDVDAVRNYFKAQGIFGMPQEGECDYTTLLELDLGTIVPSVAGPKRPQDRIPLPELKNSFLRLLLQDSKSGGYGKTKEEITARYAADIGPGQHALAMVVGGGEQHPTTAPLPSADHVTTKDTSVWTETEMMNNRPTPDRVDQVLTEDFPKAHVDLGHGDVLIAAITSCTNTSNPSVMLAAGLLAKKAVERGMKVRPTVKTSLAPGSRVVTQYLEKTGLQPYLNQLGFNLVGYGCTTCIGNSGPLDPSIEDIVIDHDLIAVSVLSGNRNFDSRVHQRIKANFLMSSPLVEAFADAGEMADIQAARPLAIFGDSVTTDHISPAGAIKATSPAGVYLQQQRVDVADFNSYGSRRGNHEVMMRGTFANVRIKNLMVEGTEGGVTFYRSNPQAEPERMSIYDAAMKYQEEKIPLVVIAGQEYGTGSSRDWAAKGTRLLGVKAVIAQSFERIHRSNLVGMGVLPCQFKEGI